MGSGYRISLLILLTIIAGCKDDESQINPQDYEGMFEKLWSDYDQIYSYFEIKEIDWDSVYDANRNKVQNGVTTLTELEEIFEEMTLALRDLHVSFSTRNTVYRYQGENYPHNSPQNAINYLSTVSVNTNTLIVGDIEEFNVAYIRIKNLSNSGDFSPLPSVLSELTNKSGMVIDLRDNGGGNDAIARGFVNKLTETESVYELVRFRNGPERNEFGSWIEAKITPDDPVGYDNPVIVLTNRGVVSSAESFVNMLKALPNTLVVGDTTRGSSGNPQEFLLPNGWSYYVSSWQVVTPEFDWIEDHGIVPDHVIANTQDAFDQGKDLILEKALDLLK